VLDIRYQDEIHSLHAGDSVYFDSAEPHSYCGMSKQPVRAIIITTPAK
jgi:hypothetical protein